MLEITSTALVLPSPFFFLTQYFKSKWSGGLWFWPLSSIPEICSSVFLILPWLLFGDPPAPPPLQTSQLPQYSQYSLKHHYMEHYYLLSILSINLKNIGKLLWAITVLREKGQKRGCALKVHVEIVCHLEYILHFLLKQKTLDISEASQYISIKPLSCFAFLEVLIYFLKVFLLAYIFPTYFLLLTPQRESFKRQEPPGDEDVLDL